ncbi:hypothetical protein F5J12DRAFT_839103 [Pisolithus orientalis]|uniref:uncharacterized protein n=1 Tax=Pisolithus orientalis TaxID=936130 RepID=UPI002225A186|nr:uncharacterized protein F5J12DRAFT_839103 [Pisolithus orientalis]KAI6003212.1 hypothetical protein F5J12DRAFT_839103 [Pisolithus orientalis]
MPPCEARGNSEDLCKIHRGKEFSINPSYQEVCMGNIGHTEAIRIEFDPSVVS